jgi:glycosyltransferase involved in cell wall biosynthesis
MKKLMLIVPSMRGGGSERVMSILANNLDRRKFDITLVLLKKEGPYLDDLESDIKIIDLNSSKARYGVFKLLKLIKASKPDIVFSTLGHLNILISILKSLLPKTIKYIARESSIPSKSHSKTGKGKILKILYKLFYNKFDLIISQSEYMKNDLINNYNISESKITIINNPVDLDKINLLSKESVVSFDKNKINLLAVGRLNKVKRFNLLIDLMSKLNDSFHLTIIGNGYEENSLRKQIQELNLDQNIDLIGFKSNPYKYMANADMLLISSEYEGFPNVVLEVNACGIPVFAFNCPGGISEIIEDGINGILIENDNIDLMAKALDTYDLRNFNPLMIKQKIKKRYSLEYIISKYERIILK